MKKFYCKALLLLCLFSNTVLARDVIYSDFDKFDFRTGEFSVIGKVGELLYVYHGSEDGYYLDAYDDRMQKKATVVLDFLPEKIFGAKFITYRDKLLIFYQTSSKGVTEVYGSVLDKTGRLMKGPEKINDLRTALLDARSGAYQYAVSPNKKKISVYGINIKGNELSIQSVCIDDELNPVYENSATYIADNRINSGEAILADDGALFTPAYTTVGGRRHADRLWILKQVAGSDILANAEVSLNGKYAGGTYMEMDKQSGEIYIGGFYADKKNGNFEGVLFSKYIPATNSYTDSRFIEFSDKLRLASGERNENRAFNDYQVKHLIVKNGGGFVLVAEDYYVTSRNNYAAGFGYYSWYYPAMATSVREYSYGDILLVSYNENGEQEWYSFIRKSQYSQEDGGLFSSHALVNTGGALGFIYNDFNMSRSRVQLAAVSADGSVDTKFITSFSKEEPDWLPRSGKQVSANEFIAPCLRRNEICFAKIVF